jgi:polyferredoxin
MAEEKDLYHFGFIFVRMCLITTLIAIFLGISFRERAWCVICPMGFLQSKIASLKRKEKR